MNPTATNPSTFVIPAKAGIQDSLGSWIPAFAGMTGEWIPSTFVIPANAGIHARLNSWIPASPGMTEVAA